MNQGFAAVLTVFVIGLCSILVGASLTFVSYQGSIMSRAEVDSSQAFYAAQAGIEEGFSQILRNATYGNPGPAGYSFAVGNADVTFSITGSDSERTIASIGSFGNHVRRISVVARNTSVHPGFLQAVHAGQGGFEMRHNTLITGKGGTTGNVYSNSYVKGAKQDFTSGTYVCKNAASKINGSVWAVGAVERLASTDDGICVVEDIRAGSLLNCAAAGNLFGPAAPASGCTAKGSYTFEPAPAPLDLPDMGIGDMKDYLTGQNNIFNGNCVADGSGSASDCTYGTGKLANQIITGNLIKPSNLTLTIAGPVWIQGNATFDSNGGVNIDPAATVSQLTVVDGRIISNSNVTFASNGTAFLLFVSTLDPGVPPTDPGFCTIPAITIASNSQSVLFYAQKGCVSITSNSTFKGAVLGEKILLENNSTIEYDPALSAAVFGLTASGGWQTLSFTED
jgi:hypothetical protein